MAQTFAQLQKQISELEAQAARLKSTEIPGVIQQIRELVSTYEITAEQIFGEVAEPRAKSRPPRAEGAMPYADADGNTWVGRGKRPQWLRDALAAGHTLDEFRRKEPTRRKDSPTVARGKATAKRRGAGRAKYSDGSRNWSGFGPQPRWLKEAIASGRSLDEFKV